MSKYIDFCNEDNCCDCCPRPPRPRPPKPYPCYCTGPTGPQGPTGPFLSSYIEASGSVQTVESGENVVFDIDAAALDVVGSDIRLNDTGTVFTINRVGLYHVEWSINLRDGNQPILLCLTENGELSSALSSADSSGNYSSGALINVTAVPFTISLQNFSASGGSIELVDQIAGSAIFVNTAASIRILRFADGPN